MEPTGSSDPEFNKGRAEMKRNYRHPAAPKARTIEETIEQAHGHIWYCHRGVYPESSVLAGQDYRQLVQPYETVEEAKSAHPGARVDLEGVRPETYIPRTAPDWFDPADAGEVWNEEEY